MLIDIVFYEITDDAKENCLQSKQNSILTIKVKYVLYLTIKSLDYQ